jgi:hypothetical protein
VLSGVDRTLTLASLDPDRKEGGVHWVCFGVPALYEEQDEAFEMVSKTGYKDIWIDRPRNRPSGNIGDNMMIRYNSALCESKVIKQIKVSLSSRGLPCMAAPPCLTSNFLSDPSCCR